MGKIGEIRKRNKVKEIGKDRTFEVNMLGRMESENLLIFPLNCLSLIFHKVVEFNFHIRLISPLYLPYVHLHLQVDKYL